MTTHSDATSPAESQSAGFPAAAAEIFLDAGVPLSVGREWVDAGIEPEDAVDYIDKGVPLEEATDFTKRGIEPRQITRTDTGYEVELSPWQEDPVEQLPEVIEPGHFGLSLWSFAPWNGEYMETEVSFDWDGKHTVEWSAVSGVGLSAMSDVSFRGVAGWPDGKDLLVAYALNGSELGFERFVGGAPTAASPDGAKDPQQWVDIADLLVALTDQLLESGIERRDEFTYEYRRSADDEWFEFDDMFRTYLASADADGTLPDFDDWLQNVLAEGKYEID
ncbi:hypothetical protein [Mycolicibacterium septicum]|uniref:hypothetical protein n=1 Tax=Mycolicibacterium septicum TaxID=98668 RepID=UPI001AF1FC29|nr:hypothetical protein [Mycolicibacterium septicum]QRY53815.1 hypothetical protein JVX95_11105 [Mycolicibacterium septicum]